eukprot:TRINITY_DN24312_c0_g1_i1.p1 TRINITY_DN24312_c0_g1~~TRINITY_DN24312_c0_g1_i1.p1  ORF type:complete len:514 (+),score=127.16 TRINITY_DN24312_c0_g1_i1:89-1630(+)
MAFIMAKIFAGFALLLGSLLALRHVEAGTEFAKWNALRLLRLTRLFGPGHELRKLDDKHMLPRCEECLAEDKDFCISSNDCIPRATFQCRGPYDHITGDKEFALHGNPDGIQHSMACPTPPHASDGGNIDTEDCYFDKDCHAKVDWTKISRIKAGFFAGLKRLEEQKDVHSAKGMMSKVHEQFHDAGMPEDRIDYIILKWVKGIYPEALDIDRNKRDPAKCYACLAEGKDFCISGNKCIPRATLQCRGPHDRITGDKRFALHGNPDGIEHSMICPELHRGSKSEDVDVKDCYFDEECHAKVDWATITHIKADFFARLKHFKETRDALGVKEMMGKTHHMFHEAGMPADRIDYILVKWVKHVFPESLTGTLREDDPHMPMCVVAKERCTKDGEPMLQGRCGVQWKACEHEKSAHLNQKGAEDNKVDVKDCYFDKECYSKVDWKNIENIKRGFFMRLKVYKKVGNKEAANKAMAITHRLFQKAGVPDDRIDYILNKWVKYVYPEILQNSTVPLTV